jgi:hypothetical protein
MNVVSHRHRNRFWAQSAGTPLTDESLPNGQESRFCGEFPVIGHRNRRAQIGTVRPSQCS